MTTIPIFNQFLYQGSDRNKDLNLDIKNTCYVPTQTLLIDLNGDCFLCHCEAWLPVTVGNILDFKNLEDIWKTPIAKSLIKDVVDKKFSHCAVTKCGILTNDKGSTANDRLFISVNIDDSCNVQCPSCRKSKIMYTIGPVFDRKKAQVYHLLDLLRLSEKKIHLTLSGNGDPLASNILRPLINEYYPLANQTIKLMTNGLLLQKQLANNRIVNNIVEYQISVDAGSKGVYEKTRLGSKWDVLCQNLEFLRDLVDRTNAVVTLTFVLQNDNFKDINKFSDLCKHFGFTGYVRLLEDWHTRDNHSEHNVIGNVLHPNHKDAITLLKDAYANLQSENLRFCSDVISLLSKLGKS